MACAVLVVCGAGATAAMAAGSGGGSGGPDDTTSTGTTETTTTGTTGTTTTGTTTTSTTPTTTTPTGTPRSPRISGIEAASMAGGKLRLRTEVTARGAKVTSVRIRYRGTKYKAYQRGQRWVRTVKARSGDGNDSIIRLRVTACAGAKCSVKYGSDGA
jgi:hypothetical protein